MFAFALFFIVLYLLCLSILFYTSPYLSILVYTCVLVYTFLYFFYHENPCVFYCLCACQYCSMLFYNCMICRYLSIPAFETLYALLHVLLLFDFIIHVYMFYICVTCVAYVLHMFCICFTYVLHMFKLYTRFTHVLHMFNICFTYVLHMFYICFAYV